MSVQRYIISLFHAIRQNWLLTDDGEGGLGGTGRLQNGDEHVKSSLGEGLEIIFGIVTFALRWF